MTDDGHWRVGHTSTPADFPVREMYSWNNRFDDSKRRFRSIYGARSQETALRELLADLRPNTGAIQRFIEKFGPTATNEIPTQPVTASWRRQHVLAQVTVSAAGVLIDLCDPAIRRDVEQAFSSVLAEYGVEHLDLSEMTSRDRPFTQALASEIYDDLVAAGISFPSRLDGQECLALFEGRGTFKLTGDPVALTDPAPAALIAVCEAWDLPMQST